MVIFIFGFVGIPHGSLKESIGRRINLGLDLKGGTHLVLQVKVAEAVSGQTDNDVARLETDLQKAGITGASVGKLDPARADTITISGVPIAGRATCAACSPVAPTPTTTWSATPTAVSS